MVASLLDIAAALLAIAALGGTTFGLVKMFGTRWIKSGRPSWWTYPNFQRGLWLISVSLAVLTRNGRGPGGGCSDFAASTLAPGAASPCAAH